MASCTCPADAEGIGGLDVSPNGRRLATCGTVPQIIIWNMQPILDEAAEQDETVPKLLAILNEHASQSSVLTVKFSNKGTFLASGSTDYGVLVYRQLATAATGQRMGQQIKFNNVENWRMVGSLRRHTMDVTALSWSMDDLLLASSSMDQNIIIWSISAGGLGLWWCWWGQQLPWGSAGGTRP